MINLLNIDGTSNYFIFYCNSLSYRQTITIRLYYSNILLSIKKLLSNLAECTPLLSAGAAAPYPTCVRVGYCSSRKSLCDLMEPPPTSTANLPAYKQKDSLIADCLYFACPYNCTAGATINSSPLKGNSPVRGNVTK